MFQKTLSFIPRCTAIAVLPVALTVLVSCTEPVGNDGTIDALFPAECSTVQGSPGNCAPLAACLEGGEIFTGAATGWLKGSFSGETSSGVQCTGTWKVQSKIGNYGTADISCSDGREGSARFAYADFASHTVWGDGELSGGGKLKVWAGPGLKERLNRNYRTASAVCSGF
ncbi:MULTISPECIES: hypothetical protein [unclassified Leisingera]|uniref:hypothetical protein n=1 Tax=unclassified Leisingera TaxID=2614906 RepID=UPI0010129D5A|nr:MULTISPECIES: hypothetical protein [unclassified Leisingera]QAX31178.1 hypothetical protein ETW24_18355 [Leisingera sp. NJS204]QBR38291.1 hypothetical protein ETW23_21455 [Leisingera sp. NJS201]